MELRRAQEKEACGVSGFLTQPVLSAEALDNLKLAHKTLRGKILGGIFPVVSHRNACFLNNEISGMRVCDEIIHLYEGRTVMQRKLWRSPFRRRLPKRSSPTLTVITS